MNTENFESRKRTCFIELLHYTGDWSNCIEQQLISHFSDYESLFYIKYIKKQLKSNFDGFLNDIEKDNSLFDEITSDDMKDGLALADINAHIRYVNDIKFNIENNKETIQSKISEISDYLVLKEKAERNIRNSHEYKLQSLKLKSRGAKFNKIISDLFKNMNEFGLIVNTTNKPDFKRIFYGTEYVINLENRVAWKESAPALKYFIKQLNKTKCIEEIPLSIIWTITCNCFCKEDRTPYSNKSLSKNTTKPTDKAISNINSTIQELFNDLNDKF